MHTSLVMTIIAKDRPGLVESVARLVSEHEGNWVESRMAHLAGQFAGILRVTLPAAKSAPLLRALEGLEAEGLRVVAVDDRTEGDEAAAASRELRLELLGQDRPGIVEQVSRVLASLGVNLDELETECRSAPMTGETLFQAHALLRLPSELSPDDLRVKLEALAAELMVDLQLED